MQDTFTSNMSINMYQYKRRHIPDNLNLPKHRYEPQILHYRIQFGGGAFSTEFGCKR